MENEGNTKAIGAILKQVIEENHLTYGIDKVRVKQAWRNIGGEGVWRHTNEVKLEGNTLIISLNLASLREDLSYQKSKLIDLLNEELQKEVVKNIILK